jgi:hypothetical protein
MRGMIAFLAVLSLAQSAHAESLSFDCWGGRTVTVDSQKLTGRITGFETPAYSLMRDSLHFTVSPERIGASWSNQITNVSDAAKYGMQRNQFSIDRHSGYAQWKFSYLGHNDALSGQCTPAAAKP